MPSSKSECPVCFEQDQILIKLRQELKPLISVAAYRLAASKAFAIKAACAQRGHVSPLALSLAPTGRA